MFSRNLVVFKGQTLLQIMMSQCQTRDVVVLLSPQLMTAFMMWFIFRGKHCHEQHSCVRISPALVLLKKDETNYFSFSWLWLTSAAACERSHSESFLPRGRLWWLHNRSGERGWCCPSWRILWVRLGHQLQRQPHHQWSRVSHLLLLVPGAPSPRFQLRTHRCLTYLQIKYVFLGAKMDLMAFFTVSRLGLGSWS